MIHIYYGKGKGKTTAALGLMIRAHGYGMRVAIYQFLKSKKSKSNEVCALKKMGIPVKKTRYGHKMFNPNISDAEIRMDNISLFNQLKKDIKNNKFDMIVLDEILNSSFYGLISVEDIKNFLQEYKDKIEIVCTGRYLKRKIKVLGDVITEMKKIKHPYDCGVSARPGIEY